jgi:hypothetical protein
VQLGAELGQHHVGQPGADDGRHQSGGDVEIELRRRQRAAGRALGEERAQLVDTGLADGLVQPAHGGVGAGIGGGRAQPRQPRMLDEKRQAALDARLEVGPEVAAGRGRRQERALVARRLVAEEPAVEVELVGEILVEAAFGDARALRDLRQRRLGVAALGELGDGLTDQTIAALGGQGEEGAGGHATGQSYDRSVAWSSRMYQSRRREGVTGRG